LVTEDIRVHVEPSVEKYDVSEFDVLFNRNQATEGFVFGVRGVDGARFPVNALLIRLKDCKGKFCSGMSILNMLGEAVIEPPGAESTNSNPPQRVDE
jgi:hypothetical protein